MHSYGSIDLSTTRSSRTNANDDEHALNWSDICKILQTQRFFDGVDDKNKINKLEEKFSAYCEEEEVNLEFLTADLCEAYGNNDDEDFMFYSILSNDLEYPLEKRQEFYHILLYNYLKLIDLDKSNLIHVLTTIIQKHDNYIDKNDIDHIIRNKGIDGRTLQKLVDSNDCNKLQHIFNDLSIMKSDWSKIHQFLNNWSENYFRGNAVNDWKQEEEEKKGGQQQERAKNDHSNMAFTKEQLNSDQMDNEDDEDPTDTEHDEKQPQSPKLDKNAIPRLDDIVNRDFRDQFPKYIYKTIWDKSDDENLEKLMDECCKKVEKGWYWNKEKEIKALYEDGITLKHEDRTKTYYDFVKNIYKEAGENEFFDKFITKYYNREINIWKYEEESQQTLSTDHQIFEALKRVDFEELDVDQNHGIDFKEFQIGFKKMGYLVDNKRLKQLFDEIDELNKKDKTITRNEFKIWKERESQKLRNENGKQRNDEKHEEDDVYHVYYRKGKRYEFIFAEETEDIKNNNEYKLIATLNKHEGHHIKWALHVKLTNKQKKKFKKYGQREGIPNGYWKELSDDYKEDCKSIRAVSVKNQMLPKKHLALIYQLLHYYYILNMDPDLQSKHGDDDTPLTFYCPDLQKRKQKNTANDTINKDIRFFIRNDHDDNDNEYQLIWWNRKGQHEPNAMAFVNLTAHEQKLKEWENGNKEKQEPKRVELCYMRFECDPNRQNLKWQWYDNNNRTFVDFDYSDPSVIAELEVTFLSNVKQNFDPKEFDARFNNCSLPKLEENLRENRSNRDYVFHCTFSEFKKDQPDWSNIIQNIEQITFNHNKQTDFSRNMRRLVDDRNSLQFLYRKSDKFARQWQMEYRLYTEQQQLYFFSFITSIVAMMKYIDIEYSNQPVVIPLCSGITANEDTITNLINPTDVSREKKISRLFEGSIIPPSDVWQAVSEQQNAEKKPSKTKILQTAIVLLKDPIDSLSIAGSKDSAIKYSPKKHKTPKTQDIYIQDEEDYGFIHFSKEQAEFLRLAECIRKFALEYDSKDGIYCLWPWYRNSFHSDETICHDVQIYDELIYKFNFVKSWTISEVTGYLKNKDTKSSEKAEKPIRFKRKFAAELLLSPQETARNINLLRNQLDPLLNDILDDAIDEEMNNSYTEMSESKDETQEQNEEMNDKTHKVSKKSYEIAFKTDLEQNEGEKQKAVSNYCKNKIIRNLDAIRNYKEDITALFDTVCELQNDDEVKKDSNLFRSFKKYIDRNKIDCIKLADIEQEIFANGFVKFVEVDEKNENIDNYKEQAMKLWESTVKYVSNKTFWSNQIQETNDRFKRKLSKHDEYGLYDENIENLKELDIDRFTLPVFKEFVECLFVNTDKKQCHTINDADIGNKFVGGRDHLWYRTFLQFWREIPIWYTYEHDILLLELVLRNRLNPDKILDDLKGDNKANYKMRLKCNESNPVDDPYYEFITWSANSCNILHRLKYVSNTIVRNLENKEYGGDISLMSIRISEKKDRPKYKISSLLFTDYQKQTHLNYVKTEPIELTKDAMTDDNVIIKEPEENKWCCCHGILKQCNCCSCGFCGCCCKCSKNKGSQKQKYDQLSEQLLPDIAFDTEDVQGRNNNNGYRNFVSRMSMDQYTLTSKSISYMHTRRKQSNKSLLTGKSQYKARINDPFIERDINVELLDTFQTFNLMVYGDPLVTCLIDQIQKHNLDAYWHILGELLNALPYPLAISAIKEEKRKDILRHTAAPEVLDLICCRLIQGASFPTSAALGVAEFFDDLASKDVVQEEVWAEQSKKYEVMAYNEISQIENDHLLYILLNLPLAQHDGESLLRLALEQKRVEFLNNDRINSLIQQLYQERFLTPTDHIKTEERSYSKLLHLLFFYPFKFYFTAQGYHWIAGMLFMLYLAFIMFYVYFRPIGGRDWVFNSEPDYVGITFEVVLWTMNLGYILYEIMECIQKGLKEYLSVGVQGQANIMDVAISVLWIALFVLRMYFIAANVNFDGDNELQQAYIFLFGIQIILLTLRGFAMFSNSEYLGIMVKVIKLMGKEIIKFLFLFVAIMVGFVFGLWLITKANACTNNAQQEDCQDFEVTTIWDGLRYVFQVFIGTGDLGGVVDEPIAISFMVLATLFGTLILTNLLIALMTTEYENVQEDAKGEVIYNRAELTSDLSQRTRFMPPPLNILVLIVTFIVDFFNFFFAMLWPSKWNIYARIDHCLFINLQNFNIWQCEFDGWQQHLHAGTTSKYKTQYDIIRWYCVAFWYDWIKDSECWSCCRKKKDEQKKNDTNSYWRIHHRECYGCLIYDPGHEKHMNRGETFRGITMTQYLEEYEDYMQQKIETKDKQLLKQLTANTLFCPFCYRPFLKDNVKAELTSPYVALLDLMSSIMFILVPVAWIPLVILFFIMTLKEKIGSFNDNDDDDADDDDDEDGKKFKHTDFDKEYMPNQFKRLR